MQWRRQDLVRGGHEIEENNLTVTEKYYVILSQDTQNTLHCILLDRKPHGVRMSDVVCAALK